MEFLSLKNPSPLLLKRLSSSSSMALSLIRPRAYCVSIAPAPLLPPKGLAFTSFSLHPKTPFNRSAVVFAASHEESKHPEIEVEKKSDDLGAGESEEEWKQALAAFKEQALKIQNVSLEAYEIYSKKAMVILAETSERLKIQADKAREDLSVVAKEISEEGKEYLSSAAQNSPESVKEVFDTFSNSTPDLSDISQVRDFYLGVPYGLLLSVGGFLSFMLTGSTSAIRFGVILGGTLLALSISSLRSYNRGESYNLALKGQAAIAAIIFLREILLLSQRSQFLSFFAISISGAMVAFYAYRIMLDGKHRKGSDFKPGAQN
ncbi:Tmemb_14 domain-containing protein [Cephalotus follicularis]|uniref:Tmemb_14 domain-containing protein n=1 Tax=Cephalotus follicularis TaxID=3775 RepID=A0A1Q3BRB9_CEPFO|nr:Tmemb_14 domain-containing protein [Cephalotus follicularis]